MMANLAASVHPCPRPARAGGHAARRFCYGGNMSSRKPMSPDNPYVIIERKPYHKPEVRKTRSIDVTAETPEGDE